jgi:hypothetical protein
LTAFGLKSVGVAREAFRCAIVSIALMAWMSFRGGG